MTWRERVAMARERGIFTDDEIKLANGWLTCAVGEWHAQMPEVVVYLGDNYPYPDDSQLLTLGGCKSGFEGAVIANDPDFADRCLDRIEDRVLALKRGEV